MKYLVSLVRTEEGYSVSCPQLPGCWSQGTTEQEALENIEDAVLDYLAVVKREAPDFTASHGKSRFRPEEWARSQGLPT